MGSIPTSVIVENKTHLLRGKMWVQVPPRPRCLVVLSNKCLKEVTQLRHGYPQTCTIGQGVKTLPFHGSNTGSNPVWCITSNGKGDSQPPDGVLRLEVALVVLPLVQG